MRPSSNSIGPNVPAFLRKLWKIVNDPTIDDLVGWSTDGESFVIRNPAEFCYNLLPIYYKHNNMSSFIRQLNMYGFHKLANENGCDKDEIRFFHPFFQQNESRLLQHIKRKIGTSKTEERKVPIDQIGKVLNDVKHLRGRQESVDTQLATMKQENAALWRELALLRQKHMKQQQIVNKLIHFLVSIVQPSSRTTIGVKRRFPLMINDGPQTKAIKINPPTDGATIHEIDPDAAGQSEENLLTDIPTVTSPLDSDNLDSSEILENILEVDMDDTMEDLDQDIDLITKSNQNILSNTLRKNKFLNSEISEQILDNENQILDTETQILNTENQILDNENQILDTENQILDTENQILDTENQILDTEPQILDTEPQILNTENQILDNDNQILDTDVLESDNQILNPQIYDSQEILEPEFDTHSQLDESNKPYEVLQTPDIMLSEDGKTLLPKPEFMDAGNAIKNVLSEKAPKKIGESSKSEEISTVPTASDVKLDKNLTVATRQSPDLYKFINNVNDFGLHVNNTQDELDTIKDMLYDGGYTLDANHFLDLFNPNDGLPIEIPQIPITEDEDFGTSNNLFGSELISYNPNDLLNFDKLLEETEEEAG